MAFSDFILRSLDGVAEAGVRSMQSINREVYRSVFLTLFFVMLPVAVLLCGGALLYLQGPVVIVVCAASALYVLGVFAVTAAGNVPLNQQLDGMNASEAVGYFRERYRKRWGFWNVVRSVSSLLAAMGYLIASHLVV